MADIGRKSREILFEQVGHAPQGGEAVALTGRREAALRNLLGDIGERDARGESEGVDQGRGRKRGVHFEFFLFREPSGGAREVSGRQEGTGGDIRENYHREAGTFAGREFAREGASACQHRTILARRTYSGI